MEQIYEKKDYHMKANKKIPKRGTEIFDENGESALSLYRGINDNSKVIFLSCTNHSSQDPYSSFAYRTLTKSEFKDILSLARDYAIQNGYNLIVNEAVAVNFDTQNFVSSGDGKFTAMTNDEIELLNSSDIYANVIIPNKFDEENSRFEFFDKNKRVNDNFYIDLALSVVSTGKIKIDKNNSDSLTGLNLYKKRSNDYSNVIDVKNSKVEDEPLRLWFEYSGNKEEGDYKVSDALNENVVINIPTNSFHRVMTLEDGRHLEKSLTIITLPDDVLNNLMAHHKTIIGRSSSDCTWLFSDYKNILSVADEYKYPELEEDLKSIDKMLYIYDNRRECLVEDKFFYGDAKERIEKVVNEVKELRKNFPEVKPDTSLTL